MPDESGHTLDQLARRERGRLIANLVHRLGADRLELAEDMVQEAVLAAMSSWPYRGMPDNPAAWLSRVAQNKAIDRLRREGKEELFDEAHDPRGIASANEEVSSSLSNPCLSDPELKLMFLCCHSSLGEQDRLMLTLKIVSGFTAHEIASIFLMSEQAVAQRLARAKRKLRAGGVLGQDISRFEIKARTSTVLKVIYLMYSAGYAPRWGNRLVLKDVAFEALRLAETLTADHETETAEAHALFAVLAFQSSRFNTRADDDDKLLLLKDQNREAWDKELIYRALTHMTKAQATHTLSRYHIEAAIAASHALAPSWGETDWVDIAKLYNRLSDHTKSPVIEISRCVALAYAGEAETAFRILCELGANKVLKEYAPFYLAQAEVLQQLGRAEEARTALGQAQACQTSTPTQDYIQARLG